MTAGRKIIFLRLFMFLLVFLAVQTVLSRTASAQIVVLNTGAGGEPNRLSILEDTWGLVRVEVTNFFIGTNTTVQISNIPPTWSVAPNGGTYNAATGIWSQNLGAFFGTTVVGPTLSPPPNSDVDLPLTVRLIDTATGAVLAAAPLYVAVDAVADNPNLAATNVTVAAGAVAPLNITSGLTDLDGSETIVLRIMGVPAGFTLSAGTNLGGGVWELTPTQLAGLTITPPAGYTGTISLTVMSYTTEATTSGVEWNLSNNFAGISNTTFTVTWGPPPPPPPPPPGPGVPGQRCDGPGPGNAINNSIANWDNVIRRRWLPTLICMTHQLSVSMMSQVAGVGMLIDAKIQLETHRLMRRMEAEAHKDYRPSTQMCTIGTGVRDLAASEEKSYTNAAELYTALMRRMTLSAGTSSAAGPDGDKRNRLEQFVARYCDLNDNGGDPDGPGPLVSNMAGLCTAGSAPPHRRNKDVDYTRTLENVYTLNFDMATPAGTMAAGNAAPATEDEEDIMALANNLYAHDIFTHIKEDHLGRRYSNDKVMEMRSVNAIRSVAFNSFSKIVGMRAEGTPGSSQFLRNVLVEMGLALPDVEKLLGRTPGTPAAPPAPAVPAVPLNLSYFAQMEILTKKMLQSPEFYTNLYDSPDNVARAGVSIQAFKLMNDRDRYESALRREMLISLILELKLREAQTEVDNSVLQSVSDMFPKR